MKSTLYVLFTCVCFALCQDEDEPDYKNILYGGVWRWPVPNTSDSMDDEDTTKAVETAIMFLEERVRHTLRRHDGRFHPNKIANLQKMKLVYTMEDRQPFLQSNVLDPTKQLPISTLLMFGYTYTFQISWPTVKDLTTSHQFIVTMYPQGTFHVYAHTSQENLFLSFPKNQTSNDSVPEGLSSVPCNIISQSKENMGVGGFLTRSCTGRRNDYPGDHYTCDNELGWKKYEQFIGESASKFCEKRSDLYFNITVMTYNIWNFNSQPKKGSWHYVERIKRLGKIITTYQPDIIALQEVRFENSKGGVLGPNQVKHLADILKQYQFVYQPAQLQPTSLREGRTEEGVAVFSRYPIIDHHYLKLFRNHSNSADRHQRLCQHVEIKLPQHKTVHIFNTHLSLSHEAREESVIQMWNYMQKFEGAAILTGDFNAEPQEKTIKYINEKTQLIDTWQYLRGNTETGYTYSTIDKTFTKRIDYIFVRRQKNVHIMDVEILDDGSKGEKAASDHVPLVGTFGFS